MCPASSREERGYYHRGFPKHPLYCVLYDCLHLPKSHRYLGVWTWEATNVPRRETTLPTITFSTIIGMSVLVLHLPLVRISGSSATESHHVVTESHKYDRPSWAVMLCITHGFWLCIYVILDIMTPRDACDLRPPHACEGPRRWVVDHVVSRRGTASYE